MTTDNIFNDAKNELNKKDSSPSPSSLYNDTLTPEEEKKFEQLTQPRNTSQLVMGIYGEDGTGKSGIVMDCRTPEEIKAGKKVIIFDLDTTNDPLKSSYHNDDPNIIVLNPYQYENNVLSYTKTHENMVMLLDIIYKKFKNHDEIKLISIDTCSKLLEICKNAMKEELNLDYHEPIPPQTWEIRRIKHDSIIDKLMQFKCAKAFVTHYKREIIFKKTIQYSTVYEPNWLKDSIPKIIYQRIKMIREETLDEETGEKNVLFKGVVEKSKTNIALEGKEYKVGLIKTKDNELIKAPIWKGLIQRLEADLKNKDFVKKDLVKKNE